MKTGTQTTEFWLTIINHLTGLALILIGAFKNIDSLVTIGSGMITVATGSYAIGRSIAKRGGEK